ncbi:hypothetical protein D3C77_449220 [compost metagenome]
MRGNTRARHEQRQLRQLRPVLPGQLPQVFKTLPTADHQAVQAFPANTRRQRSVWVDRQAAAVEFQIIDTSTLLGETLGEQFAPSFTAHDQNPRRRTSNGLMQRWQLQQCFTVVASRWKADLATMVLEDLRRGRAYRKPGGSRQLRPVTGQCSQPKTSSRFADHDNRSVTIKRAQHAELRFIQTQGLDFEQRQTAADNPLLSQYLRQRDAFFRRPGQEQAPVAHG